MFSFFHPRPVIDSRAVAVKIVQQQASTRRETHTLVVPARSTAPGESGACEGAAAAGNAAA